MAKGGNGNSVKGGSGLGSKGQSAGWPSTTGNPSGGGRDNNPPGGAGGSGRAVSGNSGGWPSTTGNPSGGGRYNNPPAYTKYLTGGYGKSLPTVNNSLFRGNKR